MKTQVSILHHDYPPGVQALVHDKVEALSRFCSDKVSMNAVVGRDADTHRVELIASVPNGPVLVADAKAGALRGALDEALSRMARKLKRTREKRTTERRRAVRDQEQE